jgi:putative selenate reductase
MAELRPYPLSALITRMFRELESSDSIFDLPRRKFFCGGERDYGVSFHGRRAASPLGPAAGPQTQMAQNIVLSWLGGCRIMELKTVQIMDELEIPRPCIDMETIGFNVEWSQELKLEESLDEYVKGMMLIEILAESGVIELAPGYRDLIYDMSVGYDLAGIKTERVQAFIDGMLDATAVIDRLRAEIPDDYKQYRDLDFPSRLSDTLTLSTFHGCPPDEIERIIEFLLEEKRLNSVVKLNPMLLGPERCRGLLNDTLGYTELRVPDTAFERDARWEQAAGFCERLGDRAAALDLGFGVKFSNTLIVENHREFFPAKEKEMYLSGPPLHVLAINLVGQFREHFGDRFPISFSAGIDAKNFADAVAMGLVPITVCSDLLKPGGYARASSYMAALESRMKKVGAGSIDQLIVKTAAGDGDPGTMTRSEAILANTRAYVEQVTADPRYRKPQNAKPPRKLGSALELFDCVSCNKCVPVCPNHANFAFALAPRDVPVVVLTRGGGAWSADERGSTTLERKQQWANFADFCNECGNCDIFCPEDGGPYVVKPRFFGNRADFDEFARDNGFYFDRDTLFARIDGKPFELERDGERARFAGDGFEVRFIVADPAGTVEGRADGEVDLTYFHILEWIREAVMASDDINYVGLLADVS